MNLEKLTVLVHKHEGSRTAVYKDTLDVLTVGVGFNLETNNALPRISALGVDYTKLCKGECELTEDQVRILFAADLKDAIHTAEVTVPNFAEHPEDVQHVIVDMIFNLGGRRFSKFKKLLAALKAKDYAAAAAEMKASQWYIQVPNRAKEDIALVLKHTTVEEENSNA